MKVHFQELLYSSYLLTAIDGTFQ